MQGLLLLAHGSKSSQWTAPFEALCQRVSVSCRPALVRLAYFEHSEPLLEQAVGDMYGRGCSRIHVEPLLLAPGFHVESDLPQRLKKLADLYPVSFTVGSVLIESERVQLAVIENCLQALGQSH